MTPEEFEILLSWLSHDREAAGLCYEKIRRKLIGFFINRGCICPEDLTDDTISRVARKVAEGRVDSEDPLRFCYGVAKNVYFEYLKWLEKRKHLSPDYLKVFEHEDREREMACLDTCLDKLTSENRALITEYMAYQGQKKIRTRQELAARSGKGMNALRIRVFRIQNTLRECIMNCVSNTDKQTKKAQPPKNALKGKDLGEEDDEN